MTELSEQSIFNEVATHLFKQGKRALLKDTNGGCAYRAPDGLKCAAGVLITDEEYQESFEHLAFGGIVNSIPRLKPFNAVISALQEVHDHTVFYDKQTGTMSKNSWDSTEGMRARLKIVADKFNLDASILNTLKFEDR